LSNIILGVVIILQIY